jgi:hypothetical protein
MVPSGEFLKGCQIGCLRVSDLLDFAAESRKAWLSDDSVEIVLSVIQTRYSGQGCQVLMYGQQFWLAFTASFLTKQIDMLLTRVVEEYHSGRQHSGIQDGIEKIMFPLLYQSHWYAICICFKSCEIQFAEGFNERAPPPELYKTILFFLEMIGVEKREWRVVRWIAPGQCDGYSCGPVALFVMEEWYGNRKIGDWKGRSPKNRLRYVRMVVELHYQNGIDGEVVVVDVERENEELKVCSVWLCP